METKMPLYEVEVAITGVARATVVAESEAHAKDLFNNGDFDVELHEWNICTDAHRDGYLDISLSRQKQAD
jgi:hypothetical protein